MTLRMVRNAGHSAVPNAALKRVRNIVRKRRVARRMGVTKISAKAPKAGRKTIITKSVVRG